MALLRLIDRIARQPADDRRSIFWLEDDLAGQPELAKVMSDYAKRRGVNSHMPHIDCRAGVTPDHLREVAAHCREKGLHVPKGWLVGAKRPAKPELEVAPAAVRRRLLQRDGSRGLLSRAAPPAPAVPAAAHDVEGLGIAGGSRADAAAGANRVLSTPPRRPAVSGSSVVVVPVNHHRGAKHEPVRDVAVTVTQRPETVAKPAVAEPSAIADQQSAQQRGIQAARTPAPVALMAPVRDSLGVVNAAEVPASNAVPPHKTPALPAGPVEPDVVPKPMVKAVAMSLADGHGR